MPRWVEAPEQRWIDKYKGYSWGGDHERWDCSSKLKKTFRKFSLSVESWNLEKTLRKFSMWWIALRKFTMSVALRKLPWESFPYQLPFQWFSPCTWDRAEDSTQTWSGQIVSRFPCCVFHICHFGFVMKHNWQIQIQNHENKSQLSREIN